MIARRDWNQLLMTAGQRCISYESWCDVSGSGRSRKHSAEDMIPSRILQYSYVPYSKGSNLDDIQYLALAFLKLLCAPFFAHGVRGIIELCPLDRNHPSRHLPVPFRPPTQRTLTVQIFVALSCCQVGQDPGCCERW